MSIVADRPGGKGMIYLSDDIEALARQVAAARGLSVEDVIARAIEESARHTGYYTAASPPDDRGDACGRG
jgi:hypothetical protein